MRKAEAEKEQAVLERQKVLEEKRGVEQAKDQALALANDLIERLKKQLQQAEESVVEKHEVAAAKKKEAAGLSERVKKIEKANAELRKQLAAKD